MLHTILSFEGFNANNMNENGPNNQDVGLWQINQGYHWGHCNGGRPPCGVEVNFRCARQVYREGGNSWRLWVTAGGCGCL